MTQGPGKKHKLAIIGGGVSAMTAAFELTSQAGWDEAYDVTIYQSGFRLGGKGASGRNRDHADRIEEHGLHIFMGFYENAFRVLRACYKELDRPPGAPLRSWREAFQPHDHIVLFEHDGMGWKPWPMPFPRSAGTPGDGDLLPPIWSYVPMILEALLRTLSAFESEGSSVARVLDRVVDRARGEIDSLVTDVFGESTRGALLLKLIRRTPDPEQEPELRFADRTPVRLLASLLRRMRRSVEETGVTDGTRLRRWTFDLLLPVLDQITDAVWDEIGSRAADDDHARRTWLLVDLMVTNVKGMIKDELVFEPFDFEKIDHLDYKEWLRQHGAHPKTVESAPVNAIYDLVFARHAGIAAGSALRGTLRMMLTYKGSIFWKMQAGMGDVIFAPLYQVLRRRGVRFRFFHRLDNVRLSADKQRVAALEMGRQATIKGGAEYEPLYDVKGLPCWPSAPLWEQLVEGAELQSKGVDLESFFDRCHDAEKLTLLDGKDFDSVVLGVSIGGLPHVAKEVLANSLRLQDAVESIRTTATQAVQLWLRPDLEGLGWTGPSPVAGTFAKPFDTWADMTHLGPRESFEPGEVGNIAYLCGHLPDPAHGHGAVDPHGVANKEIHSNTVDWLEKHTAPLWPRATLPGQPNALDYELLVDRQQRAGRDRLASQYIRASINPSDRYVLSVPGSTSRRPRTEETNLRNLFVTGDWITNGVQGGCVEAAVMAGLQTSRAICGMPAHIPGDATPGPPKPLVAKLPLQRSGARNYIERSGDVVLRGPFSLSGARLYGFLLHADLERLSELCDRQLNIGETKYRPLGPFVSLVCANIAQIRSRHPEDAMKGFMPEKDVAFWVPVVAGSDALGVFVPSHVAWFLPYVFVDNPPAMATGREIYGFPKLSGRIEYAEPGTGPTLVTVDALAIERYSPSASPREMRLVEVRPTAAGESLDEDDPGPLSRLWEAAAGAAAGLSAGLAAAVKDIAETEALLAAFTTLSPSNPIKMLFLKQFRATGDSRRACYQAVIEATARMTGFRTGAPLTESFEVHVPRRDSHTIASDLGLPSEIMKPVFAAWLDFDFDLDEGREVP